MRHDPLPTIAMRPGDTLVLSHRITVFNDTDRPVKIVGFRWELVFAEELPAEIAEQLERGAVFEVSP